MVTFCSLDEHLMRRRIEQSSRCIYKPWSGNTVWSQASGFQKLVKIDHFWHFDKLFPAQKKNVARFARNVEGDFFCDFQTLYLPLFWNPFFRDFKASPKSEWTYGGTRRTTAKLNVQLAERSPSPNFYYSFSWVSQVHTKQVHSVLKSPKKSHSTLWAKRATFTFWVDKIN